MLGYFRDYGANKDFSNPSALHPLPDDVFVDNIVPFFEAHDLVTFAKTSSLGRAIADSQAAWMTLSKRDYPMSRKPLVLSWKSFYLYKKFKIKTTELKGYKAFRTAARTFYKRDSISLIAAILGLGIPAIIIDPLNQELVCPECYIGRVSNNPSAREMLLTLGIGIIATVILNTILQHKSIRSKISHIAGKVNQFIVKSGEWISKKL